jgi:hypothetical protein
MNSDKAKQQFDILKQSEVEINRSLSLPATWHNPENNKSCKIYVRKSIDFRDKSRWPECFEWLRSQLEEFNRCFVPRLRALP